MCDVIDLQDVCVRLGGCEILRDVSWRVAGGQHWAVLGANGSGKTTLLNVVTGYLWATAGRVRVLGNPFGKIDLRELRRRIGFVSPAVGERIRRGQTARQIVLSGAFASTALFDDASEAQRARADELLDHLGCGAHAEQPYGTLSLGEQQRVLIARALMPAPELLLIDEPCAGLDLPGREVLLETVDRLAAATGRRTTMVMVTHHIEEITPRLTHVLILGQGRVLAAGAKDRTLTEGNLARAFGLRVELDRRHGRFWPRVPGGML